MVNLFVTVLTHGSQGEPSKDRVFNHKVFVKESKEIKSSSRLLNLIPKYAILKAFLVYPKKSFYDTFLFFHFVTKFLGLSSFSVPETIKSAKVYIAFLDIFTCVTFLSGSLYVLVACILDNYKETDSALLNMGIQSISFSTLVISIPPSVLNVINRHRIWKITQLISAVDDQLLHFGITINHRTDFYKLVIIVFMMSVLFTASYMLHIYLFVDETMSWSYCFFILYSKGCYYAFCINAGSYYAVIYTRFCHLNRAILLSHSTNYHIHSECIKRRISLISKTNRSVVVRCSDVYEKINQVLDLTNYCFSIPLMLCLSLCFAYTVFTIYSGFRIFKYQISDKEFYFIIRNTLWNILFALCQLSIIVIGHKITSVGKRTADLAHMVIVQDVTDSYLHDNLLIFSQQIRHRTPVSSCWLFTFDWTLMFSIASGLATYLIVLFQIENEISALNIY